MADMVWRDEFYLRCYQMAKEGLSDIKIAAGLGVTYKTFKRWKVKKRALRNALKDARSGKPEKRIRRFKDYVYNRLPDNLKEVWDQIVDKPGQVPNTVEKVERLLDQCGKKGRQHLFLYALVNTYFNVTEACRVVNVRPATLRRWMDSDPEFGELVDEIHVAKKDFCESALMAGVAAGDANLIKYVNSTLNADRFPNPKTVVSHEGAVEHTVSVVKVDDLGLSLEERRRILDAYREREAAANPRAIQDRLIDEEPEEGDEVVEAEYEVRRRDE